MRGRAHVVGRPVRDMEHPAGGVAQVADVVVLQAIRPGPRRRRNDLRHRVLNNANGPARAARHHHNAAGPAGSFCAQGAGLDRSHFAFLSPGIASFGTTELTITVSDPPVIAGSELLSLLPASFV